VVIGVRVVVCGVMMIALAGCGGSHAVTDTITAAASSSASSSSSATAARSGQPRDV
jgi:hypothetical protein